MGFKSMKMGWDICSSPPWVTFYPYTMFQNPISWPSHNKCRKTIIIQKVLVTQSCNIVHCNWHTQNPICADLQAFANTFPCANWSFFFSLLSGRVQETAKISHFVDFDWEKMDWNSLSGAYLGFEVCQIQWHLLQVPTISGSWKITISGINFTFCWFWLGTMHWNCLSGAYLGFEACQIQYCRFWVSVISGS